MPESFLWTELGQRPPPASSQIIRYILTCVYTRVYPLAPGWEGDQFRRTGPKTGHLPITVSS